ncbi:unnamed protein product, partial [Phaeothamnion confervicola]
TAAFPASFPAILLVEGIDFIPGLSISLSPCTSRPSLTCRRPGRGHSGIHPALPLTPNLRGRGSGASWLNSCPRTRPAEGMQASLNRMQKLLYHYVPLLCRAPAVD